ncbi:putative nucleoprotein [Dillard's Draw virus]|uniref:Nucleoprotein n=1 Tax=Dillard's Draw virus TaxID=2315722 RepID=A0A385KKZ4_9RHAB|nr:putative nucleoprotein [Dillard's Draw virus]AXZ78335.1 putative nucleoprotein [Dillard's Draw virus]
MEIQVYNLETGAPIQSLDLEDKEKGDYPSAYFSSGGRIRIQLVRSDLTPQQVYDSVWDDVLHDRLTITGAKLFLQVLGLNHIRDIFDVKWESFNVELAPGNGVSSGPFHAVEWIDGGESYTSTSGTACRGDLLLYCTIYICAMYRLGRSSAEGNYRSTIESTISNFLSGINEDLPKLEGKGNVAIKWVQDKNFCKLIAMLDLFFREKKDHDFAVIRMGTISSRYRECTGLTSLTHLSRLTGEPIEKAICWIFQVDVANQVTGMIKAGQEITNFRGLTPYIADLGISRRSPYSSGLNAEWHVFCHSIGVFMGSKRSIDARYLEAKDESTIMINAGLVAYVCRHRTNMVQAFGSQKRIRAATGNTTRIRAGTHNPFLLDDAEEEDPSTMDLPDVKDPEAWYDFLKIRNFRVPSEINQYMVERASMLTQTRINSMGHRIYTIFALQQHQLV